jgi:hypothetical protein
LKHRRSFAVIKAYYCSRKPYVFVSFLLLPAFAMIDEAVCSREEICVYIFCSNDIVLNIYVDGLSSSKAMIIFLVKLLPSRRFVHHLFSKNESKAQ